MATTRVYVRGSDDRIVVENQLEDLRTVAPDALLYLDVASGSKKRRTNLERLIAEGQSGDVVWVWSLDRLSREGIHATLDYLKRLTSKGVRVRSFKESWLDSTNPCYELLVSCMSFAAKLERDRLIERVTTGIRRSRAQKGERLLDKVAIARAHGSLREVGARFGCSQVYVLKCKRAMSGVVVQ
jgi:DNA invertase Pin-like site-specific DNA recombinase